MDAYQESRRRDPARNYLTEAGEHITVRFKAVRSLQRQGDDYTRVDFESGQKVVVVCPYIDVSKHLDAAMAS